MAHLRFRKKDRCAFCTNKPDSKEHAWPQWLLNKLGTSRMRIYGVVEGQRAPIDVTQKAIRVPCVCESCNTVWMKRLEDSVIPLMTPMLDGEAVRLDVLQQWTLARWAVKTSMVFEYVTHDRTLFYTDDERAAFKDLETIPTYSFAWLGRYIRGPSGFKIGTFGVDGYPASQDGASVSPYFTSMVFGQLVIQVVTVRPNESETRSSVIHPKPGPWHLSSLRIWPTVDTLAWPPVLPINDDSFEDFHRRWHNPDVENGGWTSSDIMVIPSS